MSEYQMPQQPTGDPDAPEGLEQWIAAYYFKLEYVTVELRYHSTICAGQPMVRAAERGRGPAAE